MKKYIYLFLLLLAGCAKEVQTNVSTDSDKQPGHVKTRAGNDGLAENPYSLANIQAATNVELGVSAPQLSATHLYVRFLPSDTTQYDILRTELDLDLFEYPLHLDLTDAEMEAYENTLGNNFYPWLYTKVPTDFEFPDNIEYEPLGEVFVLNDAVPATRVADQFFSNYELWMRVLNRSLFLTGHSASIPTRANNTWFPSAKILYVDDLKIPSSPEPLVGVKVRVNHLLHWEDKYTNHLGEANGFGGFINKARYKVIWEDRCWDIRDRAFRQAKITGPKQKDTWEHTIQGDNEESMCAAIHIACRLFFYENDLGLTPPPTYLFGVKIRAKFDEKSNANGINDLIMMRPFSEIRIFRNVLGGVNNRWEMISATIHELGHGSYYAACGHSFVFNTYTFRESYMRGIQFAFMQKRYPYDPMREYDYFSPVYGSERLGVVERLMRNGMKISDIEFATVRSYDYDTWRNNIKQMCSALSILPANIVDSIFNKPNDTHIVYKPVMLNLFVDKEGSRSFKESKVISDVQNLKLPGTYYQDPIKIVNLKTEFISVPDYGYEIEGYYLDNVKITDPENFTVRLNGSENIVIKYKLSTEILMAGRIGHPQFFDRNGGCYLRIVVVPRGATGNYSTTWEYSLNNWSWNILNSSDYTYSSFDGGTIYVTKNFNSYQVYFRQKIISGTQTAYTNVIEVRKYDSSGTELYLGSHDDRFYLDFKEIFQVNGHIHMVEFDSNPNIGGLQGVAQNIMDKVTVISSLTDIRSSITLKCHYDDVGNYKVVTKVFDISRASKNPPIEAGVLIDYDEAINAGQTPPEIWVDYYPDFYTNDGAMSWWQYREVGGNWINMPNEKGSIYQPEPLFKTTYFRLATTDGISNVVFSNQATVTVR